LKKKFKNNLSPIPKSGGLSSALVGLITVLTTLIILQETTISVHSNFKNLNRYSEKEIQIEWQNVPHPDNQLRPRFVESNPNAPENPPDEVKQFSFRDQQAAQPKIKEYTQLNKTPKIDSNENSAKIIKGKKKQRVELSSPPPPPLSPRPDNSTELPTKFISSKAEIEKADNQTGSYSKKKLKPGKDIEESILASIINNSSQPNAAKRKLQQVRPKTRPKLSPDLIHGPLMKSTSSAPRTGQIAIECRLHPYGVYIQEMLQSIEEQWNQLARGSIHYLQRDRLPGRISFRFKLEASGQIKDLSRIDNEGYSLAAELCRQAIASRVPFGEWTEKMINDFGLSDEMTLNFQYR
jgi:hypothetical protein